MAAAPVAPQRPGRKPGIGQRDAPGSEARRPSLRSIRRRTSIARCGQAGIGPMWTTSAPWRARLSAAYDEVPDHERGSSAFRAERNAILRATTYSTHRARPRAAPSTSDEPSFAAVHKGLRAGRLALLAARLTRDRSDGLKPLLLAGVRPRMIGRRPAVRSEPPMPSSAPRPNIFVVGDAKCGTTTLYRVLQLASGIGPCAPARSCTTSPGRSCCGKWRARAIPASRTTSSRTRRPSSRIRPSPARARQHRRCLPFLLQEPLAAGRIAVFAPDARIVILLREPAAKVMSQYTHLWSEKRETLPFEEAFALSKARRAEGWSTMFDYEAGGRYAEAVERYLRLFGRERVMVLLFEEMFGKDTAARRPARRPSSASASPRDPLATDERRRPGEVPSGGGRPRQRPAARTEVAAVAWGPHTGWANSCAARSPPSSPSLRRRPPRRCEPAMPRMSPSLRR